MDVGESLWSWLWLGGGECGLMFVLYISNNKPLKPPVSSDNTRPTQRFVYFISLHQTNVTSDKFSAISVLTLTLTLTLHTSSEDPLRVTPRGGRLLSCGEENTNYMQIPGLRQLINTREACLGPSLN